MNKYLYKVLRALMKSPRESDRNIARNIDASQASVTRARHKLENRGIIKRYEVIPDLTKLGIEIIALTVIDSPNGRELRNDNRVVFAVENYEGFYLCVSVHPDFHDFDQFRRTYLIFEQATFSTHTKPLKEFSFKDITLFPEE